MAKQCVWFLAVIAVVLFAGCENKELIQCQQDSQALQSKFEKVQENTGEVMSGLIESSNACKNQIKSLEGAVASAKSDLLKSKKRNKDCQGQIGQLKGHIAELEKQLGQLKTKTQEAQTFLQSILAENEKLKAQIKELKAQQAKADEAASQEIE